MSVAIDVKSIKSTQKGGNRSSEWVYMYKKWQKMDGQDLLGMDNSSKRRGRKLKNGGGRETNYCKCPQGAKTRKKGGVGVTLSAVSNGR